MKNSKGLNNNNNNNNNNKARRPDFVKVHKKKRNCQLNEFDVPLNYRRKLKERKN